MEHVTAISALQMERANRAAVGRRDECLCLAFRTSTSIELLYMESLIDLFALRGVSRLRCVV
jgi:hypothetical protein